MWRTAIPVLALAAALAGCIPTQQQLAMERDLEEMKRRLAEVERGATAGRQKQASQAEDRLDALARSQADQQASLDALRVELQSVNGRFEDLKRERAELQGELSLLRDDLALKITALEDRLAKVEAGRSQSAVSPPAESPEALYERGVELIQKRNEFAKGREALQEFLSRNPRSSLAVNAMYWIGESYYGEKKYESAILQFQDVIQKFGDHPKVAAALFKQGIAFETLGDRKNARVIMQRLVDTFPLSGEAKMARERLAAWERGGKKS